MTKLEDLTTITRPQSNGKGSDEERTLPSVLTWLNAFGVCLAVRTFVVAGCSQTKVRSPRRAIFSGICCSFVQHPATKSEFFL